MKIVYITAGAGRMYCGSCLRDAALARALQDLGHDILFVATYTPLKIETGGVEVHGVFYGGVNVYLQQISRLFRWTPRWLDKLFDSHKLLNFATRFSHVTAASDLADLTVSVLEGKHGKQAKELERLVDWLKEHEKPDVILLPNTLMSGLAEGLAELGAPIVAMPSGEDMFISDFPEPHRSNTLNTLKKQSQLLNALVTPNAYYADFMSNYLDFNRERIHVAPLGLDLTDYPTTPPERSRDASSVTIGYLARVCPQKGLHLLAEALEILHRQPGEHNYRVKAAGYLAKEFEPYLQDILQKIESAGLKDKFEYIGEVDKAGKIAHLSSIDLFALPTTYPEPKGFPVAEALACAAPVIVPRLGAMPEWIEATDGGVLTEPHSAASLAEAIIELSSNPDRARQLADRGHKAVHQNFNTHTTAKKLVDILETLT